MTKATLAIGVAGLPCTSLERWCRTTQGVPTWWSLRREHWRYPSSILPRARSPRLRKPDVMAHNIASSVSFLATVLGCFGGCSVQPRQARLSTFSCAHTRAAPVVVRSFELLASDGFPAHNRPSGSRYFLYQRRSIDSIETSKSALPLQRSNRIILPYHVAIRDSVGPARAPYRAEFIPPAGFPC